MIRNELGCPRLCGDGPAALLREGCAWIARGDPAGAEDSEAERDRPEGAEPCGRAAQARRRARRQGEREARRDQQLRPLPQRPGHAMAQRSGDDRGPRDFPLDGLAEDQLRCFAGDAEPSDRAALQRVQIAEIEDAGRAGDGRGHEEGRQPRPRALPDGDGRAGEQDRRVPRERHAQHSGADRRPVADRERTGPAAAEQGGRGRERPESRQEPAPDAHGRGGAKDAQHVEEPRGPSQVLDEERPADHRTGSRDEARLADQSTEQGRG